MIVRTQMYQQQALTQMQIPRRKLSHHRTMMKLLADQMRLLLQKPTCFLV